METYGKLIEVKVLSATEHRVVRHKAVWRSSTDGRILAQKTQAREYALNPEVQALKLAESFAAETFRYSHELVMAPTPNGWVFIVLPC